MSYFVWNGVSSKNFGILKHPPVPQGSMANFEWTVVPGRSPIATCLETRSTISLTCTLQLKDRTKYAYVYSWLNNANRAGELVISNDLARYYRATCTSVKASEMSLRFSSIDITFTCAPFRYSVDNEPIAMASGGTIEVGGNYYAEPKIKVYGDGTGYLTTNGDTFTLYVAKYIVLDSERLIAYNENNDVAVSATVGSFPMLQVGTNSISWSGGITSLEVTKNERWL